MQTETQKRQAAKVRAWRAAHPEYAEKQRLYSKRIHDANRELFAAKAREYRAKLDPEEKGFKYWQGNLRSKFGLEIEDYVEMVLAQGYKCAICGNEPERRLAVDHCHESEANRGLLCAPCNGALNRLETVPNWSEKAMAYLTRHAQKEN
jgi:hypothetical protein